jgi:hypothetical protein
MCWIDFPMDVRTMSSQREPILYIAQSRDGSCAAPDEDLGFLNAVVLVIITP